MDYSDVLIKYANKYLKLGWDLVAVNALGAMPLDLDFREPEEKWSSKLTSMGLEGTQVNLGVRTGSPSRLVVLEVHRYESLAPFNQRGEWGSSCVAEVGTDREQHYFVVPRGWPPPPSYFLESFQVMIFGEEGMVLAPPSLEPQAQANMRWLRPPWESPPHRPSPALCKFLKDSAPSLSEAASFALPAVPTWAEIYPTITGCPAVLQALLAPAATPEKYYETLVAAARDAGLEDPHTLLGLLWHAPLGNAKQAPQRWEYLQRLVIRSATRKPANYPPDQGGLLNGNLPPAVDPDQAPPALEGSAAAGPAYDEGTPRAGFPSPPPSFPPSAAGSRWSREETHRPNGNGQGSPEGEDYIDSWAEFFRFSRENLVVDRRRYEAMIYELGKLGAWQEFFKKHQRENKGLREKIEAQWSRELDYFRELAAKHTKKGWRKW
ncbi:MAG: bifunctional DNA primase/polymerase [Thermodesulfobacteriota bacterium]